MIKSLDDLYQECLKENNLNLVDDFVKKLKGEELKKLCQDNFIDYDSKNNIIKEIKRFFKIKYLISKKI